MLASCDICGVDIEVQLCCSGYMCGCMGIPIDPPLCQKDECYDKWIEKRNAGKLGSYK